MTITEWRQKLGLDQTTFWSRFGVSQSSGSRFEKGLSEIPKSVVMLMLLHEKVPEILNGELAKHVDRNRA
jgi:transcriptional regulator with XRE-family HTH domain